MRRIGNRWWAAVVAAGVLLGGIGTSAACTGDCSGDGEVTVNEVILGVNIALGSASVSGCGAMDANSDGQVSIDEIITAINGALGGCTAVTPPSGTPTPTATPLPVTATPCESADGTAAMTATSAAPSSGQGPLQTSCVTTENAGGTRTDLTRVSARGTVNGLAFLLQVYFVTATGEIENVSYGWSPDPDIPDFFTNLTFCSAPDCVGAAMNLASKTIRLTGTALAGEGASAVLNGTITLKRIPDPIATPTPQGCPGGSADLAFSNVQGTNASLPATLLLGAAMNFSRPAEPPVYAYLSALYDGCPMPFPRLTLGFQFSGAPLQAGTTYQVGSIDGNLNQIEFREEGFSSFKSWEAQSGSLVVDAVEGGRVTYRIVDAAMRPRDAGTSGTFTLNVSGVLAPAQ
jgi:hypothetical protein